MEKLKAKHNHKLTDCLKIIIFSLIMLAPMLAVLSTCLYVSNNKNAEITMDQTSEQTLITKNVAQTNEINSYNDLIDGNYYWFNLDELYNGDLLEEIEHDSGSFSLDIPNIIYIYYLELSFNYSNSEFINNLLENYKCDIGSILLSLNFDVNMSDIINDYSYLQININNEDTSNLYYDLDSLSGSIIFRMNTYIKDFFINLPYADNLFDIVQNNLLPVSYTEETIDVPTYNGLGDVFYYAVDELNEKPLFNWTKNTAMYQSIDALTNQVFNDQNNVLALLLTYWVLITLIYIIFDLVIWVITKLTHFLNN